MQKVWSLGERHGIMSVVKFSEVVIILTVLFLTFIRGDDKVTCAVASRCILPCTFQPGREAVIHWILVTSQNAAVHSYYHNKDQVSHLDVHYKGRTALFKDQISKGNASLELNPVQIRDFGTYKCYTSTVTGVNKETLIHLVVSHAPVDKVDIQQVENRIICSSEGIYPEPGLTWSTSPPSNMDLQRTTTIHQTEQQLYNINSSLTLPENGDIDTYTCTISSDSRSRKATWSKQNSISGSATETTIQCTTSVMKLTDFSLMWRFNHSQIILKQTGSDGSYTVSEEWRQQVKGVSESGSLTLQDLSSHHEGIYTCELSNAEETLITNTFLRMETRGGVLIIIGVIVAVLVVAAATVIVLLYRRKKKTGQEEIDQSDDDVFIETEYN